MSAVSATKIPKNNELKIYRTRNQAGPVDEVPCMIPAITNKEYRNAMSLNEDNTAYLQPFSDVDNLVYSNGQLLFQGLPATAAYPNAVIIQEKWTGTTMARPAWEKLCKKLIPGDTIVFDSVSRMSRDAEEGYLVYSKLFEKEVNLVFLKEPHVNTETFRKAMKTVIPMTGTAVDLILKGINDYLLELAREQIRIAFEQSEKEVQDLHQRTKEGIETARANGKQIGQKKGSTLNVKKKDPAKEIILKHSKSFGGSLSDPDCMKLAGVSRATFYKYKKELK